MKKSIIITISAILSLVIVLGICLLSGCQKDTTNIAKLEISFIDSVDFSGSYDYFNLLEDTRLNDNISEEFNKLIHECNLILNQDEKTELSVLKNYPLSTFTSGLENNKIYKSIYCKILNSETIRPYLPKTKVGKLLVDNCNSTFAINEAIMPQSKSGTLEECKQKALDKYLDNISIIPKAREEDREFALTEFLECCDDTSTTYAICLTSYAETLEAITRFYNDMYTYYGDVYDQDIAICESIHKGSSGN